MYTRMSPRLTFGFSVLVFFGKAEILPLGAAGAAQCLLIRMCHETYIRRAVTDAYPDESRPSLGE
ncbi:hypothetical protein AZF00_06135 [Zhongshania aliphaticivorans]|uniref:Uncharacterized protein n=1 Tax=Zhongshania aliphaticivorans TaxID=1470434 RepID=A0A127M3X3_9GAMM|nr:hypothetical protein AZF00_06135 [Zhongshania aliphaticivorans]